MSPSVVRGSTCAGWRALSGADPSALASTVRPAGHGFEALAAGGDDVGGVGDAPPPSSPHAMPIAAQIVTTGRTAVRFVLKPEARSPKPSRITATALPPDGRAPGRRMA